MKYIKTAKNVTEVPDELGQEQVLMWEGDCPLDLSGQIQQVSWGDIGGTLNNQSDLTNALYGKVNKLDISYYQNSDEYGITKIENEHGITFDAGNTGYINLNASLIYIQNSTKLVDGYDNPIIGDLNDLETNSKEVVGAINEVYDNKMDLEDKEQKDQVVFTKTSLSSGGTWGGQVRYTIDTYYMKDFDPGINYKNIDGYDFCLVYTNPWQPLELESANNFNNFFPIRDKQFFYLAMMSNTPNIECHLGYQTSEIINYKDRINGVYENKLDKSEASSTYATISDLSGKANASHTHEQSNITGLTAALDGKSNTVHTHGISDIVIENDQVATKNMVDNAVNTLESKIKTGGIFGKTTIAQNEMSSFGWSTDNSENWYGELTTSGTNWVHCSNPINLTIGNILVFVPNNKNDISMIAYVNGGGELYTNVSVRIKAKDMGISNGGAGVVVFKYTNQDQFNSFVVQSESGGTYYIIPDEFFAYPEGYAMALVNKTMLSHNLSDYSNQWEKLNTNFGTFDAGCPLKIAKLSEGFNGFVKIICGALGGATMYLQEIVVNITNKLEISGTSLVRNIQIINMTDYDLYYTGKIFDKIGVKHENNDMFLCVQKDGSGPISCNVMYISTDCARCEQMGNWHDYTSSFDQTDTLINIGTKTATSVNDFDLRPMYDKTYYMNSNTPTPPEPLMKISPVDNGDGTSTIYKYKIVNNDDPTEGWAYLPIDNMSTLQSLTSNDYSYWVFTHGTIDGVKIRSINELSGNINTWDNFNVMKGVKYDNSTGQLSITDYNSSYMSLESSDWLITSDNINYITPALNGNKTVCENNTVADKTNPDNINWKFIEYTEIINNPTE